MRLVCEPYDVDNMKRLSDFDRILNLMGELNKDFEYSHIIQLTHSESGIVCSVLGIQEFNKVDFESNIKKLWNLCFPHRTISFDYGDYSSM